MTSWMLTILAVDVPNAGKPMRRASMASAILPTTRSRSVELRENVAASRLLLLLLRAPLGERSSPKVAVNEAF